MELTSLTTAELIDLLGKKTISPRDIVSAYLEKIGKDNGIHVDFQYTASYGPVGLIKIEGTLQFFSENIGTLVEDWNEKRKMPNQIASGIHTAIMHACVPQAVGIAKDLRLPPPIPLPQVRMGKTPQKVSGGFGPEFA